MDFKKLQVDDKRALDVYFKHSQFRNCEMTFANTYLWSSNYGLEYAIVEGMLVFKSAGTPPSFSFPLGNGNIVAVLDALQAYCDDNNWDFRLRDVTSEMVEVVNELCPDKFAIEYDRAYSDYIYETESLINLTGKKYHSKRNHINKFMQTYTWNYEAIGKDNIDECHEMLNQWRAQNCVEGDTSKTQEMCISRKALMLFEELELDGGLIRVNGDVVAFAIGEPITLDTYGVHIEKALGDIPGAYQVINQQFAEHVASGYRYINREDDSGSEGLRKAKLSYYPAIILDKGVLSLNDGVAATQMVAKTCERCSERDYTVA